jgi:hypothetical protein
MLEPNSNDQEITRQPIHCPHKLDSVFELTSSAKQPVPLVKTEKDIKPFRAFNNSSL